MDYQESLTFLYGLQRFGIKLGLDNIRSLLEVFGHPQRAYLSVHVAGTNGKGSVCATLAAILRQAGYRVGLYTSPHLHSFCERIQVDGALIEEANVAALTSELRARAPRTPATFFEFTTALALKYFADSEVEIAILETGLGGRLDATNVVTPAVSVITPIALDHQAYLGSTLADIAAEKGGIIKPGVPLVIGRQSEEALTVLLQLAARHGCRSRVFGRDFTLADGGAGSVLVNCGGDRTLPLVPALPGAHQRENLATAVAVLPFLAARGVKVAPEDLPAAVASVRWPGRLEWWGEERTLLLDGAHNAAGAATLATYLHELGRPVRLVAGVKGDKDAAALLAPLWPLCRQLYATVPPVEEAVPPQALLRLAAAAGIAAASYATPVAALTGACRDRCDDELVVVAGSLFLVAAAREWLACPNGAQS